MADAADSSRTELERRIRSLQTTLDQLDDGYYRVDVEGTILAHNRAFCQILGFDPDRDLSGAKTPDFWRDPAERQAYLDQLLDTGAIRNHEVAARRVDGTPVDVLLSAHLVHEDDGAAAHIEGSVRDISEQKQAELALRERIKELDCLQDISKVVEAAGDVIERILDETVAILARSWLHTEVTVARIRLDDAVYQTGDLDTCAAVQAAELRVDGELRGAVEVGYTLARPEQDEGPFLAEERALIDAVAERLGHVIERIEYERTAEQQHKTLQAVFDGIDDVIYVADPDSHELLHVNQAARDIWGDDLVGRKCYRVLQNREAPCPFCTNDRIFGDKAGQPYIWEFQNEVSGDWFRCLDKAIRWTDGRLVRFELASNITPQKQTEESLRESEERFRRIAETAPDMIYCMSLPDGAYEYVSPAAEPVFGKPPAAFYDNPLIVRDIIHPDWHDYFAAEWDKLLADRAPPTYEYQIVKPDGRPGWVNQRNVVTHDEQGRPAALWGIVTDITERKQAQLELERHQQQLEDRVAERTAALEAAKQQLEAEVAERQQAQQALALRNRITDAVNRVFRDALDRETEEQVAQAALGVAEQLTGSAFGFIGLVNEAGTFDTIGLSNPGWQACQLEGAQAATLIRGMELRGIWAAVLKSGRAQIVNDPEAHPDRVGLPAGHPPLTSFLGVPFTQADQTSGMVALANKPGGYDQGDLEAVEALAGALHEVLVRKRMELQLQQQARIRDGQAALSEQMLGDPPLDELCTRIIAQLCRWLELPTGLLYLSDADGSLRPAGSYAHKPRQDPPPAYRPGEGLVGQAALDRETRVFDALPEDYFSIESGLGEMRPRCLLIVPFVLSGRVLAVAELGALQPLGETEARFVEAVGESICYAIASARARERQAALLEESQRMTEELQTQQEELQSQQEELRNANEELEEQTQRLSASEADLKSQQEELQVTNEELEEKTELLGQQKRAVEQARREIEAKAEMLAQASRYKSEFLANMSHELRTPLNSLLLLARSLADNPSGNLSADQVESAAVIHESANTLLGLINEILDLSKIEAGRMDLHLEPVFVAELAAAVRSGFEYLAAERGLELTVEVDAAAPEGITSDRRRIEQILRNLVSNALKFTEQGSVALRFRPAAAAGPDDGDGLAIEVSDTGIGISTEQQQLIFEAFRQVDGGTARRYEGTGLGLSISKELVRLLGGQLEMRSAPGEGSTFTVLLPAAGPRAERAAVEQPPSRTAAAQQKPPAAAPAEPSTGPRLAPPAAIDDDRASLGPDDRVVLLVEDDARFARVLADQCRGQGLRVLAAASGEEGLELARRYAPGGIVLDLKLPGMDGWQVLERLKDDPQTRHIPVHIMSVDEPSSRALRQGAIGYLQKPLTQEQIGAALEKMDRAASADLKRVLVVEDDAAIRRGIIELIGDEQVAVDAVAAGAEALDALRERDYDCMIVDLGLADIDGDELLRRIERDETLDAPPVVVYTGRELSWEEDLALRSYSDSIIVKGVRSDERLIDEVSLFLHRVVAELPEQKRQVITELHDQNVLLEGKRVLIVDDDMRTLFALSRILADRGMQILKAENGEKALAALEQEPDVDLVLMDIMMPVLDGYETMERIRAQQRFAGLPIIALTAKAMQGDQERCMQAGASDYLPKPVDQDRLISMLRVWLYR